jgi:hypothetical protein
MILRLIFPFSAFVLFSRYVLSLVKPRWLCSCIDYVMYRKTETSNFDSWEKQEIFRFSEASRSVLNPPRPVYSGFFCFSIQHFMKERKRVVEVQLCFVSPSALDWGGC